MEKMDKELTVPKWVLMVQPKITQMPQKCQPKMSAQAQKFEIFEKKLSLGVRSPCFGLTAKHVFFWEQYLKFCFFNLSRSQKPKQFVK